MPFSLIDESIVVAPRELHRLDPSYKNPHDPQLPDVGGNVAVAFRTWRCRGCGALAVGRVGYCSEPRACSKCHGR